MTEEQRKRAYAEMERRMAQSSPEVEVPVKSAPDRSAMQERIERVVSPQEKKVPAHVREIPVVRPIPVTEQPPVVSEPPKPLVSSLTVESPVAPPVVERPVQYSAPIQLDPSVSFPDFEALP